ncbi:hypothetical protein MTR67_016612 [Solanum verrucosum]|uniref:Uncharacterized protein n=1 Tax=Solanum verrucosum TaxID=315347 RepID=A0AAF0TJR4_SOLVR|nr:hypothetical protein MTR67_016612 [Solanum verrucosum]
MEFVNRVMEALAHFTKVSGLEANMEKSSLFLAGVDDGIRDQLLIRTGFTIGEFPIKYLGLPLSPKKWKLMDCHALIAKITQRITVTYSKHLSYAVDKICRTYLWGGSEDKRKVALVSWEQQLTVNKESLWVKWVHDIYIKEDISIWQHTSPVDSSWYWRKLTSLKAQMHQWYIQDRWTKEVWLEIQKWRRVSVSAGGIRQVLENIKKKHWRKFQKEVIAACYGAVLYHTWHARNWKKFRNKYVHIIETVAQIKKEIGERIRLLSKTKRAQNCRSFIRELEM